jgi:hypothetical protein
MSCKYSFKVPIQPVISPYSLLSIGMSYEMAFHIIDRDIEKNSVHNNS